MYEDLQSSRTKFDLEHCEGDLCWSLSESEGRKGRAECHLRRGDGLGTVSYTHLTLPTTPYV